ncbi:MAG: sensor histidine kinase [Candidatus Sumerlaeaceae bacterium]
MSDLFTRDLPAGEMVPAVQGRRELQPLTVSAAKAVGLACVYFTIGMGGLLLAFGFGRTQIVWSATGIAFSGLALFGMRYWPAVAIADLLLSLAVGYPALPAVGITLGKVLEAVVGVAIYRHYARRRLNFRSVADVFVFVAAAALSCMIGAGIGTLCMAYGRIELPAPLLRVWGNWWFGDLLSDLVLAPFVLNLAGAPWRKWNLRRCLEAFLLFLSLSAMGAVVFSRSVIADDLLVPFTFPLFPVLIWAALRFEQTGAAVASLLISGVCLFAITAGALTTRQEDFNQGLLTVHSYMFVISISSYCLGAAVTARRIAEERAQRMSDELRALSQKLEGAREEERVHLAREIHDQLGQQLTGLGLALAALRRKAPVDAVPLRLKADEMEEILQGTIGTVQRIATELRPGVINDLSLPEALQWLAEKFAHDSSIPVTFRKDFSDLPLEPQCKLAVFRIFQEAFANVARHSSATAAVLEIRMKEGRPLISLQDDGTGVPDSAKASPRSLGFVGMRERARACGAELRIANAPFFGNLQRPGTQVEVTLPTLKRSEDADEPR